MIDDQKTRKEKLEAIRQAKREHDQKARSNAWEMASELAQSGKVAEAIEYYHGPTFGQAQDDLLARMNAQKQLFEKAFYSILVKKTADELPDLMTGVLLWVDGQWRYTWLDAGGYWETDTDYMEVQDDQYWLPLPSFNPESEA